MNFKLNKKFLVILALLIPLTVYAAYRVSSGEIILGKNTDADHQITSDQSGSSDPYIKYDASANKWKRSDDGSTEVDLGDSGSGPVIQTKTASYTLTNSDGLIFIDLDTAASDVTITLHSAASADQTKTFRIYLESDNSYGNVCIITGIGTLSSEGSYVDLKSDGSSWHIIDEHYTDNIAYWYNSTQTTTSTTLVDVTSFELDIKKGTWRIEAFFSGGGKSDFTGASAIHVALTDGSDTNLTGLSAAQLQGFQFAGSDVAHTVPISAGFTSKHTFASNGKAKFRFRRDATNTTNAQVAPGGYIKARRIGQ